MTQVIEFLKEWIINYVKNKDVFLKTIVEIKQGDKEVDVKHKHKEQRYFLDPFLEDIDKNLKAIKEDTDAAIVCFNTKDNFEVLIKKWKDISLYKHLSMIFLNPFSETQKVWAIYPYTHSRIADEESLETGLKSMFDQVEPVDRARIEKAVS
ncbi:hypothetical protein KY308_02595 [Candidatus Woesearchaeota archaeon]|nr:hypothetical protein [Candidatus Woesearchaeota archaeon]